MTNGPLQPEDEEAPERQREADSLSSAWLRLRDWLAADRRRGHWLAVLIALTAAAAYLGVAVGGSLQSGGGAMGPLGLPERSPGLREIACSSSSPIIIEQGSRATLTFEAGALSDYALFDVGVEAVSAGASLDALRIEEREGLRVVLEALRVGGPLDRQDEYRLSVTFRLQDAMVLSECAIFVVSPPATPTPTPTLTPTPTPTRAPQQQVVPTSPPTAPTATPTYKPTFTPIIPTFTPTPTATRTPTPAATPTP